MGGTVSGQRAYIGSFTSAGGRGITTAAVDSDSGALSVLSHADVVPDPSYLALASGSGKLYAVSETDDGKAVAFSLADPDRPLLAGGVVPVGGAAPTHLAVAAGQLFTANYGSGSVSSLPLRADGTPNGQRLAVLPHKGHGPVAERQEGPHVHAVVADAGWRWLLATDLGTDSVWVYRLDHVGAAPSPHREVPMRAGTGPRHLAFHPHGEWAYVINELDSTITSCRWDAEAGALEPLVETPTRPAGTQGANYPSALVISADGRFAWAANRGDDSIAVFALGGRDGAMELLATVACGGHWPRDLALDPAGRHLYAANERSGEVAWFTIDAATGTPRHAGALAAPAASCVVCV
ncbi:lactonase family protein [Streptomyces gobiensis]|uniref:lactonase family protein n=1 Tax=Streptomyces gobiensis TaxID=2875706 RepID=UPI001E4A78B0|nr:lactonase family protein [Streptomyces gobiensis]UGY94685.1 lactonase family protein [Streptomyces gobiensis]